MYALILCVSVFIGQTAAQTAAVRPTANLVSGAVMGWYVNSTAVPGLVIQTYKGIPFAQPPTGSLRFKAPVVAANRTGTLDLTLVDPPACPQNGSNNEDCLYINVYAPQAAKEGSNLPVMFWIYGGALTGGSYSYRMYAPDYLVNQNIIFVAANYRVGACGFLNLGTAEVPGNAGLKDQRLALHWVQTEIKYFGGDPAQVTLFGESAGATSVSFHYISLLSQGLFQRAICDSGNALSETTFLDQATAIERAKALSSAVNCTYGNGTVNLNCLQSVNIALIVEKQALALTDNYVIPANTIVFPATPEIASSSPVLTDSPQNMLDNLIKSNNTRKPLLVGINKDEGTLQVTANTTYYANLPTKLRYFIPSSIRSQKSESQINSNAAGIYAKYFNNTPPSLDNLDGYIKIYGDKMFGVPTASFVRKINGFGNIYVYHFDYLGNMSSSIVPPGAVPNLPGRVGHGAELNYIFYQANESITANTSDSLTARRMIKMWTNFVKYGNPTPNITDADIGNFTWNSVTSRSINYLQITNQLQMIFTNFLEDEYSFWISILSVGSSSMRTVNSLPVLLLAVILKLIF